MHLFNSYSFTFTRVLFCLLEFQDLKWLVIFRSLKGLYYKCLCFRLVYFLGSLLHWLLVTLLRIFHRPVIIAVCSTKFSFSALYKRAHIWDQTKNWCSYFPFVHSQCRTASEQSVCVRNWALHTEEMGMQRQLTKNAYVEGVQWRTKEKVRGRWILKNQRKVTKATKRKLNFGRLKQNQLGEVWIVIRIVSLVHLLLTENGCSANV